MKKPHLLILQPGLAPYRLDIYNELNKHIKTKVVFLNKNLTNQKFDQAKLCNRLEVEYDYLTQGIRIFKRMIRFGIRNEILKFKPSVIVTVEFSSITITVALLKLLPWFSFRHIIWTDDNPESVENDNSIRKLLRPIILKTADGLIVVSNEAKTLYKNQFNVQCGIAVVPIIQMESQFLSDLSKAKDISEQLQEHHQLKNKKIILFVGRLAEEKRVDRLLHAFNLIKNSHPDSLVVLVGEGPCRASLEALVSNLGISDRILFAGRHEGIDLMAWYRLGNIFVLPSSFERFGAVVNEALLSGIPVICSDKAGARELISNGINGVVLDASNIDLLSNEINKWLNSIEILANEKIRPSLMTKTFSEAAYEFIKLARNE